LSRAASKARGALSARPRGWATSAHASPRSPTSRARKRAGASAREIPRAVVAAIRCPRTRARTRVDSATPWPRLPA
jgi:hypothetical protein